MKKLYLHIGYPKTATTTLQKAVLSKLKDLVYLGKYPYLTNDISSLVNYFVYNDKLSDDNLINIKNIINKASKNLLLSAEDLLSRKFHRIDKLKDKNKYAVNLFDVAKRVKYFFNLNFPDIEIKIVFSIREQKSMIESYYIYHNLFFQRMGFKTIDDFINYSIKNDIYISHYKYSEVIDYYENLFGKNNILVLIYEDIKYNKEFYIKEFADFINVSSETMINHLQNKKENAVQVGNKGKKRNFNLYDLIVVYKQKYINNIKVNKYISNIIRKIFINIPAFNKEVKSLNIKQKKLIDKYFKKDNKILFERFKNLKIKWSKNDS